MAGQAVTGLLVSHDPLSCLACPFPAPSWGEDASFVQFLKTETVLYAAALGVESQAEKGHGEPASPCLGASATSSRYRPITNGAQVGFPPSSAGTARLASLHTSARASRQKLSSQIGRVLVSSPRETKPLGNHSWLFCLLTASPQVQ